MGMMMAVNHDRRMMMAVMLIGFRDRRAQQAERHRDQQYPSEFHDVLQSLGESDR
jgi:hypothetical protein